MATELQELRLDIYDAERSLVGQIAELTNAVIDRRAKGITQNLDDIKRDVSKYQEAVMKYERTRRD